LAISCEPRRTIVLEFDKATRTNLAMLRNLGMAPAAAASSHPPSASASNPPAVGQRAKEEQRIVLHLPPPNGIERRVEPRFNFGSRASLFLCEFGNSMSCEILEISRSGCRLFSDVPFMLPENMPVEVSFHAAGEHERFSALIRPKLDAHLTGLLFVDMGARRQSRVDGLVAELKERNERGSSHLDL